MNRIREFVNNNPDKIIIGAGDVKQLPPIEDLTNTRKPDEYADDCINQIFKYNMMLKMCKRLGAKDDPKTNENRNTLNKMYNDMWLNCIPITDFVRKYFKTTDDLMASEKNIAYTNIRCKNVSNYIRSNLGKKDKYEVGETLICRKYKKVGNIKFNVNYRFKVVNISGNVVTLENIKSKDIDIPPTFSTLDNHFRYDYCTTCHSAQGASIKGRITIHEWEKSYLVSREWIWCALTRSTDFNDVMFFEGKTNNSELSEENLHRYLSNKIKNYKLQDEAKKRKIDNGEYVDVEWFMKRINGNCQNCGCRFEFDVCRTGKAKFDTHPSGVAEFDVSRLGQSAEFDVANGYLTNNITAQRLNNEVPHYKANCEAWCKLCNCSAK